MNLKTAKKDELIAYIKGNQRKAETRLKTLVKRMNEESGNRAVEFVSKVPSIKALDSGEWGRTIPKAEEGDSFGTLRRKARAIQNFLNDETSTLKGFDRFKKSINPYNPNTFYDPPQMERWDRAVHMSPNEVLRSTRAELASSVKAMNDELRRRIDLVKRKVAREQGVPVSKVDLTDIPAFNTPKDTKLATRSQVARMTKKELQHEYAKAKRMLGYSTMTTKGLNDFRASYKERVGFEWGSQESKDFWAVIDLLREPDGKTVTLLTQLGISASQIENFIGGYNYKENWDIIRKAVKAGKTELTDSAGLGALVLQMAGKIDSKGRLIDEDKIEKYKQSESSVLRARGEALDIIRNYLRR